MWANEKGAGWRPLCCSHVAYGFAEGEVEVLGFGVVVVAPGDALVPGVGVIFVLLLTLPTAAVIASALKIIFSVSWPALPSSACSAKAKTIF